MNSNQNSRNEYSDCSSSYSNSGKNCGNKSQNSTGNKSQNCAGNKSRNSTGSYDDTNLKDSADNCGRNKNCR